MNAKIIFFKKFLGRPKRYLLNNPSRIKLFPILEKVSKYTKINILSLFQLHDVVLAVDRAGIDGDIVEMGCWKGGAGAFLAWVVKNKGKRKRKVWLYDSFEGYEESRGNEVSNELEKIEQKQSRYHGGAWSSAKEDVSRVCKELNVVEGVEVVPGWFSETVPKSKGRIGKIAVLRIDANLFQATKYCLDELFDLVVEGGYIILDDYQNWVGTRKAVYVFFVEKNFYPAIAYTPTGNLGRAYFRKLPDEKKLGPMNTNSAF